MNQDNAAPQDNGGVRSDVAASRQEPPLPAEEHFDLVGLLRRRKWILVLCATASLVAGVLYLAKADPTYQASARVWVLRQGSDIPVQSTGPVEPLYDVVETHMELVRSPVILSEAIAKARLGSLPELRQTSAAGQLVETLAKRLVTARNEKSQIFSLSFAAAKPATCSRVVNAVARAYQEFVNASQRDSAERSLEVLSRQQRELETQLADKEQDLVRFQEANDILLLAKDGNGRPVIMNRISTLHQLLTQAVLRRLEAEAFYEEVKTAVDRGFPLDAYLANSVLPSAGGGEQMARFQIDRETQIMALKLDIERLSKQYGSNHPKMRELCDRLTVLEAAKRVSWNLEENPLAAAAATQPAGASYKDSLANLLVQTAKQRVEQQKAVETRLMSDLERERDAALALSTKQAHLAMKTAVVGRLRGLYDVVVSRIKELHLNADVTTLATRVVEWAKPPAQPLGPSKLKALALALLSGLFVGLGLMWLADSQDRSFRSPEDVRAALRLPIIGNVPALTPAGASAGEDGVSLSVVNTPNSREAEAFRALRTVLGVAAQSHDLKTFLFTSPNPSDGKTTLVCNLAVTEAQLGSRVLLIDADLRRSRVHELFGADGAPGLGDYLSADDPGPWRQYLVQGKVPNLDLMPAGPPSGRSAELLGSARYRALMDEVRASYDYVFCDSSPVLPVTDPCVVAGVVDATVLVIRIEKNERAAAIAAHESLKAVNARMLGVVMNDVGARTEYGYAYYGQYTGRRSYRNGYKHYETVPQDGNGRDAGARQAERSPGHGRGASSRTD